MGDMRLYIEYAIVSTYLIRISQMLVNTPYMDPALRCVLLKVTYSFSYGRLHADLW